MPPGGLFQFSNIPDDAFLYLQQQNVWRRQDVDLTFVLEEYIVFPPILYFLFLNCTLWPGMKQEVSFPTSLIFILSIEVQDEVSEYRRKNSCLSSQSLLPFPYLYIYIQELPVIEKEISLSYLYLASS